LKLMGAVQGERCKTPGTTRDKVAVAERQKCAGAVDCSVVAVYAPRNLSSVILGYSGV
jgi:hypothetical protein